MMQIKKLTKNNIPQIINLSLQVFSQPESLTDHFHQERVWQDYYDRNGLLLGAFINEQLVGYVFFYDREKDKKSSHCWMAGVNKTYRGKGILKSLMFEAQKNLKERGYEEMTINTYPEKFPAMFDYLTKYNFIQEKEEEREWQGHMTRKCFFRKPL